MVSPPRSCSRHSRTEMRSPTPMGAGGGGWHGGGGARHPGGGGTTRRRWGLCDDACIPAPRH
eukprot:scaffold35059_cov96-Isochrysis_galbana.AAC.1